MPNSSSQNGIGIFQKLKNIFFRTQNLEDVDLRFEMHLMGQEIRVLNNGVPIQLILGPNGPRLHIYPNPSLNLSNNENAPCFIIFDPDRFYSEISGFLRLEYAETLIIGRGEEEQQTLFQFPISVSRRYVTIAHAGDALIFKDLNTDKGTYISALDKPSEINKLIHWREKKLARLLEIYGGPIKTLSPKQALFSLKQVNHILNHEAYRPKDSRGLPGGVIVLPDNMTPIILGDLHAQVDNMIKILSENAFLAALDNHEAYLVILGDAVHSEIDGEMEQFETSILLMDLIFKLKIKFPKQVFYLKGNHDSFSSDVCKSGIPQGILWEQAIRKERGAGYLKEMNLFYDNLPVVAIARDFIACHAAPPKARATMDLLINTHQYPGLVRELIWNRMKRPNYQAGYTQGDVKRFRKALDLDPNTHFIVAHNPLNQEESVWRNAGDIKNHHIVFSGRTHCMAIFSRIAGEIVPMIFPAEPMLDWINQLDKKG